MILYMCGKGLWRPDKHLQSWNDGGLDRESCFQQINHWGVLLGAGCLPGRECKGQLFACLLCGGRRRCLFINVCWQYCHSVMDATTYAVFVVVCVHKTVQFRLYCVKHCVECAAHVKICCNKKQ